MKKIVSVLTIAIVCNTVGCKLLAQKYFAGTVKVEIKYEGDIDPQKHIPQELEYTIFENKTKTTVYNGLVQIMQDGDALTETQLWDLSMFGFGRLGTAVDREAMQNQLSKKKFSYEERSDTKTICGYVCKGYNVTVIAIEEDEEEDDDEDDATEIKLLIYTTTEIGKDGNINAFDYPGLSGFPMYSEFEKNDVKTIVQVKEVKKGKIKAVDFMIPSDYKMYDKEGFQKEMERIGEEMQKSKSNN